MLGCLFGLGWSLICSNLILLHSFYRSSDLLKISHCSGFIFEFPAPFVSNFCDGINNYDILRPLLYNIHFCTGNKWTGSSEMMFHYSMCFLSNSSQNSFSGSLHPSPKNLSKRGIIPAYHLKFFFPLFCRDIKTSSTYMEISTILSLGI